MGVFVGHHQEFQHLTISERVVSLSAHCAPRTEKCQEYKDRYDYTFSAQRSD